MNNYLRITAVALVLQITIPAGIAREEIDSLVLPEPVREVQVANGNQLRNILGAAQPGDHIILQPGVTYVASSGDTFNITSGGTADNPVVIRSAGEPLYPEEAATIASHISINADHVWLYRLHVAKKRVSFTSDYNVLLRCWFIGYTGTIITPTQGSSFGRVEYCHIQGPPVHEALPDTANRGMQGHGARATRNWIIRRTVIKDIQRPPSGRTYLGGAIGFGHNVGEFLLSYNWIIEYCLFQDIASDQATNVKGSDNIFRYCVFENVNFVSNRGGLRNKYHGLLIRDSGGMWIWDDDTELLGVVLENSGSINVFSGFANQDVSRPSGAAFPARNTVLAGCVGNVAVGNFWNDWDTHASSANTMIEGCVLPDGSPIDNPEDLSLTQYAGDIDISPTTDREIPQPVELTPFDVGPNGDLTGTDFSVASSFPADANSVLYEKSGHAYNGGELVVGRVSGTEEERRRTLVRFDLEEQLPDDALVFEASLVMYAASFGPERGEGTLETRVHRLLGPWQEGSRAVPSDADGTAPDEGDATWLDRSWPDVQWTTPGGDYSSDPSATLSIGQEFPVAGLVEWTSESLIEDVQGWIEDPDSNHGWIILGDESAPGRTINFRNRYARSAVQHPTLKIRYGLKDSLKWGPWEAINDAGDLVDEHLGLGWINIQDAPWIYVYAWAGWVYAADPESGWIYVRR